MRQLQTAQVARLHGERAFEQQSIQQQRSWSLARRRGCSRHLNGAADVRTNATRLESSPRCDSLTQPRPVRRNDEQLAAIGYGDDRIIEVGLAIENRDNPYRAGSLSV